MGSGRTRRSRFVEVDGHRVLKLNNYSLAEGESDIAEQFDRLVAEVLPVVEAPAFEAGIEVEGRPAS